MATSADDELQTNITNAGGYAESGKICDPGGKGVFMPFTKEELELTMNTRAMIYLFLLLYMFMGVNVASDYFMTAIEFITSKKKRRRDPKTGRLVTVVVWNSTVANLTLMALGSSAPEILLNCIETMVANKFYSGALGPSTIVGSAAFNLLIIIAVCISAVDSSEIRRIKEISVYHITVVFSMFAYLWLLGILAAITPDVVDLWEAAVTLAMFPVLVVLCFLADKGHFTFMALEPQEEAEAGDVDTRPSHNHAAAVHPRMSARRVSALIATKTIQSGGQDLEHIRASLLVTDKKKTRVSILPGLHETLQHGIGPQRVSISMGTKNKRQEDIIGEDGVKINAPHGIIAFEDDAMSCEVGSEDKQVECKVQRRNGMRGTVSVRYTAERLTAVPGYDYYDIGSGKMTFEDEVTEKVIKLTLMSRRPGEKTDAFQVILSDVEGGAIFNPMDDGGDESAVLTISIDNLNDKAPSGADMFWAKTEVCCDWDNINLGLRAWRNQIVDTLYITGQDEDDEDAKYKEEACTGAEADEDEPEAHPDPLDYVNHVLCVPWKFIFSVLSPPPNWLGGWLLFVVELGLIGVITALIADLADLFGCCVGLQAEATAITLVALGTSLPDTFASMTSAKQDEYADASIVNVTGSNSVNVFLGIGVPWCLAAIYWLSPGDELNEWKARYPTFEKDYPNGAFIVEAGNLGFSVTVFNCVAVVALCILRMRRLTVGGELGGSYKLKVGSSVLLFLLWLSYVQLSILRMNYEGAQVAMYPMLGVACIAVGTTVFVEIKTRRRRRMRRNSGDVDRERRDDADADAIHVAEIDERTVQHGTAPEVVPEEERHQSAILVDVAKSPSVDVAQDQDKDKMHTARKPSDLGEVASQNSLAGGARNSKEVSDNADAAVPREKSEKKEKKEKKDKSDKSNKKEKKEKKEETAGPDPVTQAPSSAPRAAPRAAPPDASAPVEGQEKQPKKEKKKKSMASKTLKTDGEEGRRASTPGTPSPE